MKIKMEFTENAEGKQVLDDETLQQIQIALDECNSRATAFTITSAGSVKSVALSAERYLDNHNVVDSDRNGAVATYRPGGPSANAYKNSAISTEVTLKRAAGVWSLVAVDRVDVYPRNPSKFRVSITDKASANLQKRMLAAFGREPQYTPESVERMLLKAHAEGRAIGFAAGSVRDVAEMAAA